MFGIVSIGSRHAGSQLPGGQDLRWQKFFLIRWPVVYQVGRPEERSPHG